MDGVDPHPNEKRVDDLIIGNPFLTIFLTITLIIFALLTLIMIGRTAKNNQQYFSEKIKNFLNTFKKKRD